MRVYLGADHAGFELKNVVKDHLEKAGYEVVDCGAHEYDALDDYPPFCIEAARRTVADDRPPAGLRAVGGGRGAARPRAAGRDDRAPAPAVASAIPSVVAGLLG